MAKIEYVNWSTRIFDGFYESTLYNSDTEYNLNNILQDDENKQEYEIDFEAYTEAVADFAVELLKDYCINNDNIISKMTYKGLSSPRYYNFDTDKLVIDLEYNEKLLFEYIETNKTDFNTYLHDNFTSYDGFWSFTDNNYNDFMQNFDDKKEQYTNVMIEYYILRCIYNGYWTDNRANYNETSYHYELYDNLLEYQMNYCKMNVTDNIGE